MVFSQSLPCYPLICVHGRITLFACVCVCVCVCAGVGAASLAKLTFMVGGLEEEYQAAQELLTCMGANVVYCGQVGTGQV